MRLNRVKLIRWGFEPLNPAPSAFLLNARILIRRFILIGGFIVCTFLAMSLCLWIVPNHLSTAKEWTNFGLRLGAVAIGSIVVVHLVRLYKVFGVPEPRLAGRALEEAEAAERQLAVRIFAAVIGASSLQTRLDAYESLPTPEQMALSRLVAHILELLSNDRALRPTVTPPAPDLALSSVYLGLQVREIFSSAGYKLVQTNKTAHHRASSNVRMDIKASVEHVVAREGFRGGPAIHPPDTLPTLTKMIFASRHKQAESASRPHDADILIDWIDSMSITICQTNNSEDPFGDACDTGRMQR